MRHATLVLTSALGVLGDSPAWSADLRISIGAPIPLAVYGYISSGEGSDGGSLDFLGAAGVELSFPWASGFSVAVWCDGALIAGSDGDATAFIYFATAGAGLGWRHDISRKISFAMSAGPAVLASGIVVDDGLRLDTWSVGGRAAASLDIALGGGITLGPWLSFLVTSPPLDAETWFNRPLGGTRVFSAGLSMQMQL